MLSESQYIRLLPFQGLIKLAAESGAVASTAAWETMQQINIEMGRPPVNGYCPSCALDLYREMNNLLNVYKN